MCVFCLCVCVSYVWDIRACLSSRLLRPTPTKQPWQHFTTAIRPPHRSFSAHFARTAHGSSLLTVLETPKSLDFQPTDAPLSTGSLTELYSAALGAPVIGNDPWTGLRIADAFNTPLLAVTFVVSGAKSQLQLATPAARYQLSGAGVQAALAQLEDRVQTQQIDLVSETKAEAKNADTKFVALKPESNAAERKFIAVTAAVARLADSIELEPSATPRFVSVSVPVEGLAASAELAQTEGRKLLQQAVQTATRALNKKFGGAVLVTVVEHDTEQVQRRQKRQAEPSTDVSRNCRIYK